MDSINQARRALLSRGAWLAAGALMPQLSLARGDQLDRVLTDAQQLRSLETVIVCQNGKVIAERGFDGHSVTAPTNIKSASKSIISALTGIAIDRGLLKGVDQRVVELLKKDLPAEVSPSLRAITIGHLLSMQAGLRSTSGSNYGRWVASDNWVRTALTQPFVDKPGGAMQYSTGSSHLLSAILTQVTGKSTVANARDWFAPLNDFSITAWQRDPQGIYMGGNQMSMSPRSLLAFGELYRTGGRSSDGTQVVSTRWIEQSWTPRTTSVYTGEDYGYAWFIGDIAGARVPYAWGYGGQMLYIVPELGLTVVMTSDASPRGATTAGRGQLHALLSRIIGAVRQAQESARG